MAATGRVGKRGILNNGIYQVGYLRLLDDHRVLVPGLRYHVSQRVLQVQDSLQADSTHYWPLAALRGFDLGTEDDTPPDVHRYRTRLVQQGRQGPPARGHRSTNCHRRGPAAAGLAHAGWQQWPHAGSRAGQGRC